MLSRNPRWYLKLWQFHLLSSKMCYDLKWRYVISVEHNSSMFAMYVSREICCILFELWQSFQTLNNCQNSVQSTISQSIHIEEIISPCPSSYQLCLFEVEAKRGTRVVLHYESSRLCKFPDRLSMAVDLRFPKPIKQKRAVVVSAKMMYHKTSG